MVDAPDLQAQLAEYEAQLNEVSHLLLDDPDNDEYQAIYENLAEVIQLTRDVLAEAPPAAVSNQRSADEECDQHGQLAGPAELLQAQVAAATSASAAAPVVMTSLLPPQVAEQIRHAQQRAALSGQGPAEWAIGAKCRAVYSGDGNWYNAVVEGVAASGGFFVVFDGYGTKEEVGKDAVQLQTAEEEGGYRGVAAPKRRRVDDNAEVQEMPKWLEVKPTDDEKTRQKKRKLAKAYKSKARFAKLDLQQKQKADAWKRFLAGKPKKSKTKGK